MQREIQPVVFTVDGDAYEIDPASGSHTYSGADTDLKAILDAFEPQDYVLQGPNQEGLEHLAERVWGSPSPREMRRRIETTLNYYDGVEIIHE